MIYGSVTQGNTSATAGVQKNDTTFDQYFCNGSGGASTGGQSYILQACSPSPTPTASPSALPRQLQLRLQRQRQRLRNGDGNGNGNSHGYRYCYRDCNCNCNTQLLLRRQGLHRRQGHVRHRRPDRKAC